MMGKSIRQKWSNEQSDTNSEHDKDCLETIELGGKIVYNVCNMPPAWHDVSPMDVIILEAHLKCEYSQQL